MYQGKIKEKILMFASTSNVDIDIMQFIFNNVQKSGNVISSYEFQILNIIFFSVIFLCFGNFDMSLYC